MNSGKGAGEEGVSSSAPGVHKCQYSAKHYSSSHSLRTHEKWHRGDLGHPCSHCDKKFRNPSEVRRHEMTHTGEKPHKCPHCPTKFIQKVSIVSDVIIDKTNPCLKFLKLSPEQNIQKLLSLLLALVLVKLRNTCKKEMNRKKLERPNICYIFEKLVVQG